jgi:peptidoglycan/xylan/chitin deacetylase (PgdA/CDA1 family)
MPAALTVVMYHYVRDLPRTRFPRIKGLLTEDFRQQVAALDQQYEMATLASALAFLRGDYRPARDLCLLTFDDGLKDHLTEVLPILAERRLQGVFFIPTSCLEDVHVASVHKNHFLLAAIEFEEYRRAFVEELTRRHPETPTQVDPVRLAATYRWDTPEVAAFKFLLNFGVPEMVRDGILDTLFAAYLGDEQAFARELYLSWEDARQLQAAGMLIGSHSHNHTALSTLSDERQRQDLKTCTDLLQRRLRPQPLWPFSYPYGRKHTYNEVTVNTIRELRYCCSFGTEPGVNPVGQDLFALRRIDTKDVTPGAGTPVSPSGVRAP